MIDHHLKCYDVQTVATLLCLLDPPVRKTKAPIVTTNSPQQQAEEPQVEQVQEKQAAAAAAVARTPAKKSMIEFNIDLNYLSLQNQVS